MGTFLLYLPISSRPGHSCSLIDALFTATSAVCVTGLIVRDTPVDFSLFGQLVICGLIQVGGFGYMTSATILAFLAGKRIGVRERIVMIQESLTSTNVHSVKDFIKAVAKVTLLIEAIAAVILSVRFMFGLPAPQAILNGFFHSISAFNNAGFALFSDNLMSYQHDPVINFTILFTVVAGALGFLNITEFYNRARRRVPQLTVHAKISLWAAVVLTFGGATLLLAFDYNNPDTLGPLSFFEKSQAAIFHSAAARTAGFNTINIGAMSVTSLFLIIVLMFIGGSPGSTAGGVKTTAAATVLLSLYATIRGRLDVQIYGRRLPQDLVAKAFLIVFLGALCLVGGTFMILIIEGNKGFKYLEVLFEVTSALGTTGLSYGDGGARSLTALFSPLGKLVIIVLMFLGRLGPLTVAAAVLTQAHQRFRYPETRIQVG
ncbi:MAG: TrkH family potassium uptake protein [Nitrospirota bacterium]|nr:TrkH family potassium uptake protein [Nitrospirota bacterium]